MTTTNHETLQDEFAEADLTGMLPGLLRLKRGRDEYDSAYKAGSKPVRDWLDKHPGEQLREGEQGIVARLKFRQGSPDMDVVGLAEREPDLALWAAQHGLLKLDVAAWKALQGKGPETAKLEGWLSKLAGTEALIIESEEK